MFWSCTGKEAAISRAEAGGAGKRHGNIAKQPAAERAGLSAKCVSSGRKRHIAVVELTLATRRRWTDNGASAVLPVASCAGLTLSSKWRQLALMEALDAAHAAEALKRSGYGVRRAAQSRHRVKQRSGGNPTPETLITAAGARRRQFFVMNSGAQKNERAGNPARQDQHGHEIENRFCGGAHLRNAQASLLAACAGDKSAGRRVALLARAVELAVDGVNTVWVADPTPEEAGRPVLAAQGKKTVDAEWRPAADGETTTAPVLWLNMVKRTVGPDLSVTAAAYSEGQTSPIFET